MQPYFLPYLGYFSLIDSVDKFIIFDTPKFKKKSWMTRNRILHVDAKKEFNYINLRSVKQKSGTSCSEIILLAENKEVFISKNLQVYKKMRAFNYQKICSNDFLLVPESEIKFSEFIYKQLRNICNHLEINTEIVLLSETEYQHDERLSPGLHALRICKYFGASTYINAPNGRTIFDPDIYYENDIELKFLKPNLESYQQSWRQPFIPNLSILDALMFNEWSSFRRDYLTYELE